jgi:hypothetical protein
MAKSTISAILKNKEATKATNIAKGVKTPTSKGSPAVEEVEKHLMIWMNEKQVAGDSMSEAIICEKARHLYSDITKDTPGFSPKKNSSGGSVNEPQPSTSGFQVKEGQFTSQ